MRSRNRADDLSPPSLFTWSRSFELDVPVPRAVSSAAPAHLLSRVRHWAAVAAMALQESPSDGGRGLIVLASLLTLSAVALNAASILATHRMTDLISSYDAFLYIRALEFGSSLSLAAGLFLLTSRANLLGLPSPPKLEGGRQQPVS